MTQAPWEGEESIEFAARRLYETAPNQVKPRWDQCGETTQSVWIDMAIAQRYEELA